MYRAKKVYGQHPRELTECAFDIVTASPGRFVLYYHSRELTECAFDIVTASGRRLKCTIVIMRCPSSLTFHIFNFSSGTTEQNSTKLKKKQGLNILFQVCVFRADRKNKMAALASDWLRHFLLLLWNRWTEFNAAWQEERSQRPLPEASNLVGR